MPVDPKGKLLPGELGKDYVLRTVGGVVYAIYTVPLGGGKTMMTSYKISKEEYQAYGVDPKQIKSIPASSFQNVQHLGNASEIILNGTDNPWVQYLDHLQEVNGNVSWLHSKEFMGTMLEGYLEGWSSEETQQALKQTKWYENKTQTQRSWVLDQSKADQNASINSVLTEMKDQLTSLYGADVTWGKAGIEPKELKALALKIASGTFGTAQEGLQIWYSRAAKVARKTEGTIAWMTWEQQSEQQKQFANRPEEMFQTLKDQAYQWLGPQGQLDNATLKNWSDRLVTQKSSQADWEQYLQKQTQDLYPYLSTGETWQDRASSYKKIAEDNIGAPVQWGDKLLSDLGAAAKDGKPTGKAMSYQDFTSAVRSDGRFWQGPVAAEDTYGLFNKLNSTFNGV